MKEFNLEEKIVHEKVNGTIERCYNDRREIIHLEKLFNDRTKGAIGLRIRGIKITGKYFMLLCSDEKSKRGFRIYLTHSQYGNSFRLTATEVIFRDAGTLKNLKAQKKEFEKEIEKAKADGDEGKVKELERWKQKAEQDIEEYKSGNRQMPREWEEEEEQRKMQKKRAKAEHLDRELDSLVMDTKLQQLIPEDIGTDSGKEKVHKICAAEEKARIIATVEQIRENLKHSENLDGKKPS